MGDDLGKVKINLFGNTFAHHTEPFSSTHTKESKYIEWDKSGKSSISIHVDDGLFLKGSPSVEKENRYGWLLEAESVTPQFYINAPRVLDHYKCIFTSNESLLRLDSKFVGPVPLGMIWIHDKKIHIKNKLVSMIASNKADVAGHVYRLQWVDRLKGKIPLFGRGFNPINKKEEALNDFMFSVAIENCGYGMNLKNYFTEKLLDCFATGTIPIYFGCSNIEKFFNPEGVIKLDHSFDPNKLTPDLYYSKMEAIKENFERCQDYEVMEDFIFKNYIKS